MTDTPRKNKSVLITDLNDADRPFVISQLLERQFTHSTFLTKHSERPDPSSFSLVISETDKDKIALLLDEVCFDMGERWKFGKDFSGSELILEAGISLDIESTPEALTSAYEALAVFFTYTVCKEEFNYTRLGMQEILRNALEHGSCGLDGEAKKKLSEDGKLENFLREKADCSNIINIKVEVNEEGIALTTTDNGAGFNWFEVLGYLETRSGDTLRVTQRGLLLVKQLFDVVFFNEKGNQITCVKKRFMRER